MKLLFACAIALLHITIATTAPSNTEEKNDESIKEDKESNVRQKRWYNYYSGYQAPQQYQPNPGYNYPIPENRFYEYQNRFYQPMGPIRDFNHPPQYTPYIPVIFVPQFINCGCASTPTNQQPNNTSTSPSIENRFPEMEDTRQNWGIVPNYPRDDTDYSSRPINLEPSRPTRPLSRQPPPVEHGSSQGDATTPPTTANPLSSPTDNSSNKLSSCDGAILTCCLRSSITLQCFQSQGCADPFSYGNPCNPEVVLSVVEKYKSVFQENSIQ